MARRGNYHIRDRGGRPGKEFAEVHIIEVLSVLQKGISSQIYRKYIEMVPEEHHIALRTCIYALNRMADEGRLIREQENDSKLHPIYSYRLKTE